MLSYCLKPRKIPSSKNPKVAKTYKEILMTLSKCALFVAVEN